MGHLTLEFPDKESTTVGGNSPRRRCLHLLIPENEPLTAARGDQYRNGPNNNCGGRRGSCTAVPLLTRTSCDSFLIYSFNLRVCVINLLAELCTKHFVFRVFKYARLPSKYTQTRVGCRYFRRSKEEKWYFHMWKTRVTHVENSVVGPVTLIKQN